MKIKANTILLGAIIIGGAYIIYRASEFVKNPFKININGQSKSLAETLGWKAGSMLKEQRKTEFVSTDLVKTNYQFVRAIARSDPVFKTKIKKEDKPIYQPLQDWTNIAFLINRVNPFTKPFSSLVEAPVKYTSDFLNDKLGGK